MWHILQRARLIGDELPVVLATTVHPRDDALAAVGRESGVAVVRGSEDDVLGRFLQALDEFPARWVVRVCGDSPLFDPGHLARCLALAREAGADVVRFPAGVTSLLQGGEVVSAAALHWSRREADDDPLAVEHVTAWALRHAPDHPDEMVTTWADPPPELVGDLKLSIDTPEDLARMRRLYEALWDGGEPLDLTRAAVWSRTGVDPAVDSGATRKEAP